MAALTAPTVTGVLPRLIAPKTLTTAERSLFTELVNACGTDHFRSSDVPLLITYVQATLIAQAAARNQKKLATWEKAARLQATLATRLRLAPQGPDRSKDAGP
jgi:hypothetical protein